MIDSEASWLRTAIDPDAAIGPFATIELVGAGARLGGVVVLGAADASVASGLDEGVGPPQAATTSAVAAHMRRTLRTPTIQQRYAPPDPADGDTRDIRALWPGRFDP
jgi:hypothetical protein